VVSAIIFPLDEEDEGREEKSTMTRSQENGRSDKEKRGCVAQCGVAGADLVGCESVGMQTKRESDRAW
jgi:hypothetical protein